MFKTIAKIETGNCKTRPEIKNNLTADEVEALRADYRAQAAETPGATLHFEVIAES